jgi:hypothetical protein
MRGLDVWMFCRWLKPPWLNKYLLWIIFCHLFIFSSSSRKHSFVKHSVNFIHAVPQAVSELTQYFTEICMLHVFLRYDKHVADIPLYHSHSLYFSFAMYGIVNSARAFFFVLRVYYIEAPYYWLAALPLAKGAPSSVLFSSVLLGSADSSGTVAVVRFITVLRIPGGCWVLCA